MKSGMITLWLEVVKQIVRHLEANKIAVTSILKQARIFFVSFMAIPTYYAYRLKLQDISELVILAISQVKESLQFIRKVNQNYDVIQLHTLSTLRSTTFPSSSVTFSQTSSYVSSGGSLSRLLFSAFSNARSAKRMIGQMT